MSLPTSNFSNSDAFASDCALLFSAHEPSQKILQALLLEYQRPERQYHNLNHIEEMSSWLRAYRSDLESYSACFLACLYHDVVYDTRASDNELRSSRRARDDLGAMGFDENLIKTVELLIESTASHTPRLDNFDCKLFLDADLAILGSNRARYDAYLSGVRAEYAWVSEEVYRAKRSLVLNSFLKRERIYLTDLLHTKLDSAARSNLRYEIELLSRTTAS